MENAVTITYKDQVYLVWPKDGEFIENKPALYAIPVQTVGASEYDIIYDKYLNKVIK